MLKKITYPHKGSSFELNINGLEKKFSHVCVFDSNSAYTNQASVYTDKLIAIGASQLISTDSKKSLTRLETFIQAQKGNWLFGYLSYELKNELEQLNSENTDELNFPKLCFFVPTVVIEIKKTEIQVYYNDSITTENEAIDIYQLANEPSNFSTKKINNEGIDIKARINKKEYLHAITQLQHHIQRGDIYEINFCQEFYALSADINPANVFIELNKISRAPFAAFCKFDSHYIICSSPERFIRKSGNHLISQPIKGTIKRSVIIEEDEYLKNELRNNKKEQNENVMIVDLVRNDLSRIATTGSVNVDELFGVYSFKQVHQMISTVSCTLPADTTFTDIIKNTFPMGSMTGAPKVSAMQLIEKHESTKRGVYSGSVGYISPEGNFDFNVIIRSILYNMENKYLSFMVGSAITYMANAEAEYDECMLKAKAMFEVLDFR